MFSGVPAQVPAGLMSAEDMSKWWQGVWGVQDRQLSISFSQLLPLGNVGPIPPNLILQEKLEVRVLMLNLQSFKYWQQLKNF